MRTLILACPLFLAACSSAGEPDRSPESNVTVEAGSVPGPVPSASSAVDDVPPPADALPSPEPAGSATPANEAAAATLAEDGYEESAEAAAQIVQRYYRLIGRGDFAGAWRQWDDGGRASGMSEAEFARSFDRFARYDAAVGRPGRIESGAGQRYVEVPVAITGATRSGEPLALNGTVVMHRAGPIDGATAEQRRWRIARAEMKPRPAETAARDGEPTPTPAPTLVALYRCGDGTLMRVRFDRQRDTADVELGGSLLGELDGQRPASGIWYKRGDTELRGKGGEATIVRPGAPELRCSAQG